MKVLATVLDSEGYPHVLFEGRPQDVADALAIYLDNVSHPLMGVDISPPQGVDFISGREPTEE
jgi:hypothetical protein